MDEARLIERLRLIESLFSGAASDGERTAADRARSRILERLKHWEEEDPPVEYRFSMRDMWSRKVFAALLRRYGIQPYRYSGQRHTTVMARVSSKFVDELLMPEFQEISDTLRSYLTEITDRVVHQVIHQDSSEAETIEGTRQLPPSTEGPGPAGEATAPLAPPVSTSPSPAPDEGEQERGPDHLPRAAAPTGRGRNKRKKRKKRRRR